MLQCRLDIAKYDLQWPRNDWTPQRDWTVEARKRSAGVARADCDRTDDMISGLLTTSSSPPDAARLAEPPSVAPISALVSTAVNLGWIIDKLQRLTSGESLADDLPKLPFARAVQVYYWQVESSITEFSDNLHRHQVREDLGKLHAAIEELHPEPQHAHHSAHPACIAARHAIDELHFSLMAALTAEDYKLGKAYLLGYGLASLYRASASTNSANKRLKQFVPGRIEPLLDYLADLHSVLPHNTAGTIALSLQLTVQHFTSPEEDHRCHTLSECAELRLQGHRWRAMLTGESKVTEVLETADYLTAARTLIHNFRDLLRHAVRQLWVPLGLLAIIGGAGAAISFLTASGNFQVIGALLSFSTTFLASVRLVSPSMVRVIERATPELWDKAVMAVVAQALPRPLPQPEADELQPK